MAVGCESTEGFGVNLANDFEQGTNHKGTKHNAIMVHFYGF